jgi:hypothetical protein
VADQDGTYEFNVSQTTKVNGAPMPSVNLVFKAQGMKQETFLVPKDGKGFDLPKLPKDDLQF